MQFFYIFIFIGLLNVYGDLGAIVSDDPEKFAKFLQGSGTSDVKSWMHEAVIEYSKTSNVVLQQALLMSLDQPDPKRAMMIALGALHENPVWLKDSASKILYESIAKEMPMDVKISTELKKGIKAELRKIKIYSEENYEIGRHLVYALVLMRDMEGFDTFLTAFSTIKNYSIEDEWQGKPDAELFHKLQSKYLKAANSDKDPWNQIMARFYELSAGRIQEGQSLTPQNPMLDLEKLRASVSKKH